MTRDVYYCTGFQTLSVFRLLYARCVTVYPFLLCYLGVGATPSRRLACRMSSASEPGRRVRLCPVRTPCCGFEPVSVEPLLYR